MPFWRLYYHIVWATRDREPWLTSDVEPKLYAYLVSKAAALGVYVYAVNGWHDHVHLVVAIPPKHAVADVVKRLKGASSHELTQGHALTGFAWQRGYGALSVGERHLSVAVAYVDNQKDHHARQTTNAWLELCAELDEGPDERSTQRDGHASAVREREVGYDVRGEPPF